MARRSGTEFAPQRRRTDIMPLVQQRLISRQPIQPSIPAPRRLSDDELVLREGERHYFSQVLVHQEEMRKRWEEARQAHIEALTAQKGANQAGEEATMIGQNRQWKEIASAFEPDNPSVQTQQLLAFRGEVPPEDIIDEARRIEGVQRAREFGRTLDRMPPDQREAMAPMAAALTKEHLDPEEFQRIVGLSNRRDEEAKQQLLGIPNELRVKANKVISSFSNESPIPVDQEEPRYSSLLKPETYKGMAEGAKNIAEGIGEVTNPRAPIETGLRGAGSILKEAGQTAVESGLHGGLLTERGRGELAEGGKEIGKTYYETVKTGLGDLKAGLDKAFLGEQQLVTPLTRPYVNETLDALGVPESKRDWIDRNVVPYIVPSTVVGAEEIKGANVANRVGRRFLVEGTINMLQGDAAAEHQGRDRNDLEKLADFALGGAAAGIAPEVIGKLFTAIRKPVTEEVETAAETATRPAEGAIEPGERVFYHGNASETVQPHEGMFLTPNKADAELYADKAVKLGEGTEPRVHEIRVPEEGVAPVEDYVKPGGAYTLKQPELAKVGEQAAPADEDILDNLGRNLGLFHENTKLGDKFVSENVTPAFMAKFGDAPVMSIKQAYPSGGEPLLRIHTGGWRPRAEQMGLEFAGEEGYSSLWRIPGATLPDESKLALPSPATKEPLTIGGGAGETPKPMPRIPTSHEASAPSGSPIGSADDVAADATNAARRRTSGAGRPPTEEIDLSVAQPEIRHAAEIKREAYERGDSLGSLAEDILRGGQRKYIKLDAKGNIIEGATAKVEGQSMDWHDVMSRPSQYDWASKEAREYAESIYRDYMLPQIKKLKAAGLLPEETLTEARGERYIPRTVTEVGGKAARVGPRGGTGAKQAFELPRIYEFAGQANEKNKYLNDIGGGIGLFIRESERRLADQDFANVVNKYGQTPAQRIPTELKTNVIDAQRALKAARNRFNRVRTLDKANVSVQLEKAKNGYRRANAHLANLQKEASGGKQAPLSLGQKLREAERKVAEQRQLRDDLQEASQSYKRGGNVQTEAALKVEQAKTRLSEARATRTQAYRGVRRAKPGEAMIREPFASSRIFPEEVAKTTEESLRVTNKLLNSADLIFGTVNSALKPHWAALDWSFTGLQTLPALGVNPAAWADMQRITAMSLIRPEVYDAFMLAHKATAEEMINIGKVPLYKTELSFDEFMKQPLPPVLDKARAAYMKTLGRPFQWGNDAWSRGINVISIYLWEQGKAMIDDVGDETMLSLMQKNIGLGDVKAGNALEQLGASISHMTGRLTASETAAITPGYKALNRMLPFAGRFQAAWGKLIYDAATKGGMQGSLARRALAGWAATGIGLYSIAAFAAGQEPHLDPRDSKFMTMKLGGYNVGVGGPLQQVMSLAGKVAAHPEDSHQILTKFARGKSSPIVSLATDLITGSTYMGKPLDSWEDRAKYLLVRTVPFASTFALQQPTEKLLDGDLQGTIEQLKEIPANVLGLRSWPVSSSEILLEAGRNVVAELPKDERERLGIPDNPKWEDLPPSIKEEARIREPEAAAQSQDSLAQRASAGDETAQTILLGREASSRHAEQLKELSDNFAAGKMEPAEYRNGVENLDLALRSQRDFIEAEHGISKEQGRPEKPGVNQDLYDYFQIFDKYPKADVDPEQKDALFAEIDQFRSGLSKAREDALDENMHLDTKDIPVYQELKKDRKRISDSDYWDIKDETWQELRRYASAAKFELPETYDEYVQQKTAELNQLAQQAGYPPGPTTDALVQQAINGDRVVKVFDQYNERARTLWKIDHADIIPLLVKWGYKDYAKSDIPFLAQQEYGGGMGQ